MQTLLNTLSLAKARRFGVAAYIPDLYGQVFVFNAGGCYLQRVAVFEQDGGELA